MESHSDCVLMQCTFEMNEPLHLLTEGKAEQDAYVKNTTVQLSLLSEVFIIFSIT